MLKNIFTQRWWLEIAVLGGILTVLSIAANWDWWQMIIAAYSIIIAVSIVGYAIRSWKRPS